MTLHNMKTLAASAGIHYRTLRNYRKRYIETNPRLSKKFGTYGRDSAHYLTHDQVIIMIENIPHLKHLEV